MAEERYSTEEQASGQLAGGGGAGHQAHLRKLGMCGQGNVQPCTWVVGMLHSCAFWITVLGWAFRCWRWDLSHQH